MSADEPIKRPRLFAPGMRIGMHVQVERVIRETPNRTYYLVNNARRRWYAVKCWSCGNQHSPPSAQSCTYCGKPLGFRRLLLSSRWDPKSAKAIAQFAKRRLKGPTLASPVAMYRYKKQLLTLYRWDGENMLVNLPAPLPGRRILILAFQLADALQRLHDYGVVLKDLGPEHVLVRPDGSAQLFDLEVDRLLRRSIEWNEDPTQPPMRDVRMLAAMLDDYCPVEAEELREIFTRIRRGKVRTADEMASMVASYARRNLTPMKRSRAACLSDTGLVQRENQDAWGWQPLGGGAVLYAVADGIGGHIGSQLTVRTVTRLARRRTADHPIDGGGAQGLLMEAFGSANQAIRKSWQTTGQGDMGADATMTLALTLDKEVVVASIGDVYTWVLRGGKLESLGTRDKRAGLVGGKVTVAAKVDRWKVKEGDRLVIGTRGLWTEVPEDRMIQILKAEADPRAAVRKLVRAANDAGGSENITAMVVDL